MRAQRFAVDRHRVVRRGPRRVLGIPTDQDDGGALFGIESGHIPRQSDGLAERSRMVDTYRGPPELLGVRPIGAPQRRAQQDRRRVVCAYGARRNSDCDEVVLDDATALSHRLLCGKCVGPAGCCCLGPGCWVSRFRTRVVGRVGAGRGPARLCRRQPADVVDKGCEAEFVFGGIFAAAREAT